MFYGVLFLILVVSLVFVLAKTRIKPMVVQSIRARGHDSVVTMKDGRAFCGSGTVWREYPGGARCSTSVEYAICDAVSAYAFANDEEEP